MADQVPLFTADCLLEESFECWKCKYKMLAGTRYYPVENSTKNSKSPAVAKCCKACAMYYFDKAISMGRISNQKSFEQHYGITDLRLSDSEASWNRSFNVMEIYQRVNAAQKKGKYISQPRETILLIYYVDATRAQRAVSAMPEHLSDRRATSSARSQRTDLDNSMPPPAFIPNKNSALKQRSQAIGYNPDHSAYEQALNKQRQAIYPRSDKLISIAFHIGAELIPSGRGKRASHIPEMRNLGITETDPRVSAYAKPSELRARAEGLLWKHMLRKYPKFTGNAAGDTGTEFHHNDKPFEVALILPEAEWEEYEEMMETAETVQTSGSIKQDIKPKQKMQSESSSSATATEGDLFTAVEKLGWEERYNRGILIPEKEEGSSRTCSRSVLSQSSDEDDRPSKKHLLWESPPRGSSVQRAALMSGGAVSQTQVEKFNSVQYFVCYYPVHITPWTEIYKSMMAKKPIQFNIDTSPVVYRHLSFYPDVIVGKGSFCTAHDVSLTLDLPGPNSQPPQSASVVANRYTTSEELERVVGDGNMHMFVSSLFGFAESWVAYFLKLSKLESPVTLPELKYVNAGIVTCHDVATGNTAKTLNSRRMSLVLEDKIPNKPETFQKYINNGSASIENIVENLPINDNF
ncbi:hypothetical protein K435DRAFT_877981 [Dendrothele bispora CBS 962.96]|uniref:Uncharacterized protein n=1 Tax=Dendrothele bispora (strain CBS 962.96) TaxID=1314807 RepID=A0A4S8KP08_DENBC|nr:hypothetical protein K435DRAFT_877981 [Dendrothele bispora CBS 962.96]